MEVESKHKEFLESLAVCFCDSSLIRAFPGRRRCGVINDIARCKRRLVHVAADDAYPVFPEFLGIRRCVIVNPRLYAVCPSADWLRAENRLRNLYISKPLTRHRFDTPKLRLS